MGQKEVIANLLLAIIPMVAALIAVTAFNLVYPNPILWGYISIAISSCGLAFFIVAKVSVFKAGKLLSFGTKSMQPLMRAFYWIGYLLMAGCVILTLAAASIMKHRIK